MKIIDFEIKGNCVRFYLGKDSDTEYHGDDWNDSPYDCNAGRVYSEYITGWADLVFPLDALVLEPCSGERYTRFAKDDMKNGVVPCVVVVPPVYAEQEYEDSFSYWCNHKRVTKFFFGDKMEPTLGLSIYYFNPKQQQFLEEVDARMVTTNIASAISGCMPFNELPIWQKLLLTMKEASLYFGISQSKLQCLTNMPDCPFLFMVGKKKRIKRKELEKYLEDTTAI